MNIGGISNITIVENLDPYNFRSKDIGPGNSLIDSWVRNNSEKKFDKDGMFSSSGKKNDIILEQAQELYLNSINKNSLSFDVNFKYLIPITLFLIPAFLAVFYGILTLSFFLIKIRRI